MAAGMWRSTPEPLPCYRHRLRRDASASAEVARTSGLRPLRESRRAGVPWSPGFPLAVADLLQQVASLVRAGQGLCVVVIGAKLLEKILAAIGITVVSRVDKILSSSRSFQVLSSDDCCGLRAAREIEVSAWTVHPSSHPALPTLPHGCHCGGTSIESANVRAQQRASVQQLCEHGEVTIAGWMVCFADTHPSKHRAVDLCALRVDCAAHRTTETLHALRRMRVASAPTA